MTGRTQTYLLAGLAVVIGLLLLVAIGLAVQVALNGQTALPPTVTSVPLAVIEPTASHTVDSTAHRTIEPTAHHTPITTTPLPTPTVLEPTTLSVTTVLATPTPLPTLAVMTPTRLPTAVPAQGDWPPSQFGQGELTVNYPLQLISPSGQLQVYYQPSTYPAGQIATLTTTLDTIWADIQTALGQPLGFSVDVYLAGTLFGNNPALQGFTQSYEFRTFVLVNGAFHPGEAHYILAHELTHIAATHSFGLYSSPMLHEGLALYLPQHYLVEEAGYLPHQQICAILWQSGQARSITDLVNGEYGATTFGGHIRTFGNYNLSGCFVGYLVETYGMGQLGQVYSSGDYLGVYGRSLAELEAEWLVVLAEEAVVVDPAGFTQLLGDIATAYDTYLTASAGGIHADWSAYLTLNQARFATNRGDLPLARSLLADFWAQCVC